MTGTEHDPESELSVDSGGETTIANPGPIREDELAPARANAILEFASLASLRRGFGCGSRSRFQNPKRLPSGQ